MSIEIRQRWCYKKDSSGNYIVDAQGHKKKFPYYPKTHANAVVIDNEGTRLSQRLPYYDADIVFSSANDSYTIEATRNAVQALHNRLIGCDLNMALFIKHKQTGVMIPCEVSYIGSSVIAYFTYEDKRFKLYIDQSDNISVEEVYMHSQTDGPFNIIELFSMQEGDTWQTSEEYCLGIPNEDEGSIVYVPIQSGVAAHEGQVYIVFRICDEGAYVYHLSTINYTTGVATVCDLLAEAEAPSWVKAAFPNAPINIDLHDYTSVTSVASLGIIDGQDFSLYYNSKLLDKCDIGFGWIATDLESSKVYLLTKTSGYIGWVNIDNHNEYNPDGTTHTPEGTTWYSIVSMFIPLLHNTEIESLKLSKQDKLTDDQLADIDSIPDKASAEDLTDLRQQMGELSDLTTTAKSNLVAAINEAAQSGGGESDWELLREITLTEDAKPVYLFNKTTDGSVKAVKCVFKVTEVTGYQNIRPYCNNFFFNITTYKVGMPYIFEFDYECGLICGKCSQPASTNYNSYTEYNYYVREESSINDVSINLYNGTYHVGDNFKVYVKR